jgi:transposase
VTAVEAVREAHPAAHVRLWAQDEHRLGLKPVLRRVWARRGQQPVVPVRPRYQWLYVVSFVEPETGETFWLLLPAITSGSFQQALEAFAQHVDAGPDRQVLLVLDRAGWHCSRRVTAPDGVRLVFLPAYSPELQPAERLWSLLDEPIANRVFATLDDLAEVLVARCQRLRTLRDVVRGRACFHWWPRLTGAYAQ